MILNRGVVARLTPASVLEYLASLQDGCSHPGAELRGGRIHRVDRTDRKIPPAGYFSDSVTLHPHLDAETVSVAAHLGIGNVLWMNVFDGVHTTRAMQGLALDGGQTRDADLINVSAAAKLDMFGRRPYFAIVGVAGLAMVHRIGLGVAVQMGEEEPAPLRAGLPDERRLPRPASVGEACGNSHLYRHGCCTLPSLGHTAAIPHFSVRSAPADADRPHVPNRRQRTGIVRSHKTKAKSKPIY